MWQPVDDKERKCGIAVWNFDGKVEHGLPLEIGDAVHILEENMGWYRGYCSKKPSVPGIFPTSYVHIREPPIDGEEERRRKANEPLIQEVTLVLREWHVIFVERFMKHKMDWFKELKKIMLEVIDLRSQLLSGTMTLGKSKEVKGTIMSRVDWGNCRLELDLVPSVDGEIIDSNQCSLVELHQVHLRSAQETKISALTTEPLEAFAHHLHLQLVNFGIHTGEAAEAFFALYDAKEGTFITERYLAKFNKQGAPLNVEKIGNLVTIFTDMSNKDMERDLYLTCHIIRCGQMKPTRHQDNKKATGPNFRRPYGYGVLKVTHILKMPEDDGREGKEEVMKIYVANQADEKDFASLHDQIIRNTSRKGTSASGNIGITVKLLMLHGHLDSLKKEKHLLFNRGHSVTHKLGFSDIIMPGDLRNDLFIALERGEFYDKNAGRNIEVTMCTIDEKWKKIGCICLVDDEEAEIEYRSVVYLHYTAPRWNELVRLNVPMDSFKNTHIRFEFRHCSKDNKRREKRLFAMAFMPLMKKDGTAVEDSTHSLFVFKCSEHHDFSDPTQYLSLPYCSADMVAKGNATSNNNYELNCKDTFTVKTVICSTKLVQNINLLGLLKWRQHPDRLHAILEKLSSVSGQDIVRVLQDILDALFSILDERSDEYGRQIFECLVHIISVLGEQRFKSFTTVLDTYIDNHFVSTLAHQFLVYYLMMYIDKALQQKQDHITNMLEGLQYLFKFIFRSHILYKMATGDVHDGDMQDSIRNLFNSINNLMQKDDEKLEKHQLVVLRKFSTICNELMAMAMYTAPEVSQFTADLLLCIPHTLRRTKVLQSKLECIREAINSTLFKSPMARRVLLQPCLAQLQHHIQAEHLPDVCIAIVEDILTALHTLSQTEQVEEEISLLIRHLFREILGMVPTSENMTDLHTRCITCLMEMLRLMKEQHYVQLTDCFPSSHYRQEFLNGILMLFAECVTKDIYSKDWAAMRMVVNRVILTAIKRFCSDLNQEDMIKMRSRYFELAVFFIIQPVLQLESFTSAKQERLKKMFGDMRIAMATELIEKWNSLGQYKSQFSHLTRNFLEVTMIPHDAIRKASLPLIFDIMCSEMKEKSSFIKLEDDLIDKLDHMVCVQNNGDEQYTVLFNNTLREKISTQPWQEEGEQFVEKVTRLLERLIDYRNVCNKSVENRYLKLSCLYQLMNFYKDDERRKDIYMRYIYHLHDLHLHAGDYTEAAHTLLMLAMTLDWTDNVLPSDKKHEQQTEAERKTKLYGEIIELVKKGQVWEYGIPLCKELAIQYESKQFDYKNLSVQLVTQAQFFENIRNQPRQPPTFFRIKFYGIFPILRKHREYIYRGQPFDQPQIVIQRFQADFPQAKPWTGKAPPTEEDLLLYDQYIEVRHVICVPPQHPHLQGNVPPNIRYFAENYDISVFSFDRPFHRGERDKTQDFKTLWVERTFMTTGSPLPGLLSWSEIVKTVVEEIRPIANAVNVMREKNTSMQVQIQGHRAHRNSNINPLSMVLQGTIEAAVQGGIKVYQDVFLTAAYGENNPTDKEAIITLKELMIEQLNILDDGVLLHKELCSEELMGFHLNLEKKLAKRMQEFDLGQPKVYSKARPPSRQVQSAAPPPPANVSSGPKTFKRNTSDLNLQQPKPDRKNSMFYFQTPVEIPVPSRTLPEGGGTLQRGRATIATTTPMSEEVHEPPGMPPPDMPPPPLPNSKHHVSHVDPTGYIRILPKRNRSQSVFTILEPSQKQSGKTKERKDSLPTPLALSYPNAGTAIQEFTTDVPDSAVSTSSSNRTSASPSVSSARLSQDSQSSSSNLDDRPPSLPRKGSSRPSSSGSEFSGVTSSSRISESPSVSSLMSRISADSQASYPEERPPQLPPRKMSSRPSSGGSGGVDHNRMSSSSSCSGTDVSEEGVAPPVPSRTAIPAKDSIPHGPSGTGNANLHLNSPSAIQTSPSNTVTRDPVHSGPASTTTPNMHPDPTTTTTTTPESRHFPGGSPPPTTPEPRSFPRGTPSPTTPEPRSFPRGAPPPTIPRNRRPSNLTSPVPHPKPSNGLYTNDTSTPGAKSGSTPILPNRPEKRPKTPLATSPSMSLPLSPGPTTPGQVASPSKNGDAQGAPPVPIRPNKRKESSIKEQGGTSL
ncbi:dedicator of cytokinesis protein 4 isoform X5 [Strongylocentrotus purpuratus]|uniref:Dedicator of cytokinesis protein 1 n=1 Tax=Strongylocentrotus purpuratus TaxID=7668 RepID=A0A7M7HLQ5_STRPU|nr:dedicator of cytokinesis protein 4 isoform X5 [Strongylocentrotus purpuratus]|eukprot:XP_011679069.1 PREDICTED: dedicator of cytokinesis protein 4 isoform X4 [Strongylocentrotus purpuratus]